VGVDGITPACRRFAAFARAIGEEEDADEAETEATDDDFVFFPPFRGFRRFGFFMPTAGIRRPTV
tara:strand:+ start:630 stop:824 length:195 start_codon:yes stop_codon:yes gene_type:complete